MREHTADYDAGLPYFSDDSVTLHHGDSLAVLRALPDASVDCCVTSPPYFGLRDYGEAGQYGLEASPAEYVETMRAVFAEVRRVLAADGTLWLNIGDSYSAPSKGSGGTGKSGLMRDGRAESGRQSADSVNDRAKYDVRRFDMGVPPKNLLGIPWRTAFALQDDGWIFRNDIIWNKPNAMPESVTDRFSARHEHLFMLSKSRTYWFNLGAVREPHTMEQRRRTEPYRYQAPGQAQHTSLHEVRDGLAPDGHPDGKNPGDVWSVPTQPFAGAHFAVMPAALAERAILAGCKPGGTVLDPFSGSGTTGLAAAKHGRRYVGIDLSADYLDLSLRTRLAQTGLDFGSAS